MTLNSTPNPNSSTRLAVARRPRPARSTLRQRSATACTSSGAAAPRAGWPTCTASTRARGAGKRCRRRLQRWRGAAARHWSRPLRVTHSGWWAASRVRGMGRHQPHAPNQTNPNPNRATRSTQPSPQAPTLPCTTTRPQAQAQAYPTLPRPRDQRPTPLLPQDARVAAQAVCHAGLEPGTSRAQASRPKASRPQTRRARTSRRLGARSRSCSATHTTHTTHTCEPCTLGRSEWLQPNPNPNPNPSPNQERVAAA